MATFYQSPPKNSEDLIGGFDSSSQKNYDAVWRIRFAILATTLSSMESTVPLIQTWETLLKNVVCSVMKRFVQSVQSTGGAQTHYINYAFLVKKSWH